MATYPEYVRDSVPKQIQHQLASWSNQQLRAVRGEAFDRTVEQLFDSVRIAPHEIIGEPDVEMITPLKPTDGVRVRLEVSEAGHADNWTRLTPTQERGGPAVGYASPHLVFEITNVTTGKKVTNAIAIVEENAEQINADIAQGDPAIRQHIEVQLRAAVERADAEEAEAERVLRSLQDAGLNIRGLPEPEEASDQESRPVADDEEMTPDEEAEPSPDVEEPEGASPDPEPEVQPGEPATGGGFVPVLVYVIDDAERRGQILESLSELREMVEEILDRLPEHAQEEANADLLPAIRELDELLSDGVHDEAELSKRRMLASGLLGGVRVAGRAVVRAIRSTPALVTVASADPERMSKNLETVSALAQWLANTPPLP